MNDLIDLSHIGLPGNFKMSDQSAFDHYKQLNSGIFVPGHIKRYPTAFDFFCGAGGFSLGIIQAGFEIVGAVEFEPSASHTYMANLGSYPISLHYSSDNHKQRLENYFQKFFDKKIQKAGKVKSYVHSRGNYIDFEHEGLIQAFDDLSGSGWIKSERLAGNYFPPVKNFFFGDVREFSGLDILRKLNMDVGELDLIVGGPPCQGFSKANNRKLSDKVNDPRNNLVFEYARMICEMQPKTFVMEEVPEFLKMYTPSGVPVIHQFLRILEDGGFMSYEAGLKALAITEKDLKVKSQWIPVTKSMKPGVDPMQKNKKKAKKEKQLSLKLK